MLSILFTHRKRFVYLVASLMLTETGIICCNLNSAGEETFHMKFTNASSSTLVTITTVRGDSVFASRL